MSHHAASRLLARLAARQQQSCQIQQSRSLNIHEYQGAALMSKFGVNVSKGVVVSSVKEIAAVLKKDFPDDKELVVQLGVPAQAVALVGSPAFPNAVKWSDDNLLAIASGHLVTILNPAELTGPKGFVPISQSPIFDIGKVEPADLHDPELFQFRLARDGRTGVRSIDWSPQGVASHGGCLLAVCTTDSRVKLYRAPFCDFRPEWVEVGDVTELMYACFVESKFQPADVPYDVIAKDDESNVPSKSKKRKAQTQEPQHRKVQRTEKITEHTSESADGLGDESNPPILAYKRKKFLAAPLTSDKVSTVVAKNCTDQETVTSETPGHPITSLGRRLNGVESLEFRLPPQSRTKSPNPSPDDAHDAVSPSGLHSGSSRIAKYISPTDYAARNRSLSPLVVAWSPTCYVNDRGFVFCAVGTKAGSIWLLRVALPEYYSVEIPVFPEMSLLGEVVVHNSWISTISWGITSIARGTTEDIVVLSTGSSDGSVKLWSGNLHTLAMLPSGSRSFPLYLLREVEAVDNIIVSSLALKVPKGNSSKRLLAFGKGCGQVSVCKFDHSWNCTQRVNNSSAHDQVVTGLVWTTDGQFLYSCSQDNMLHKWELSDSDLCTRHVTDCSSLLKLETPQIAIDLPASVLDLYYGIALSPGMLSMAVVRGVTADMVDQMYQARAQKGVVQLYWISCQKTKPPVDDVLDLVPFDQSSQSGDLDKMKMQILLSLQQMEDPTQPLVLWEIVAALACLKHVTSAEFVISVILNWVSTWCKGDTDTLYTYLDSLLSSLAFASSRQLQIFCVLYRQLLLAHVRVEVLNGRYSQEQFEALGERIPNWGKISSPFRHSEEQEDQLKKQLWRVEHELRQRLYWGTLALASCLETAEQLENRLGDMEVVRPLVVNWVIANKSECFPQLVKLAEEMTLTSNDMPWSSVNNQVSEHCYICGADVPLDSPEVAKCSGVESETGFSKHKLQRCSISVQVCSGNPLWYCCCCARRACALAPASFFSLPSRPFLEKPASYSLPTQQTPLPACPFCGILMHRYLPDFLLSPKLV